MPVERQVPSDIEVLGDIAPMSRRGFLGVAAAAGLALAAGPVRADAIVTDSKGLTIGDAHIKVSDGEIPGYFARPADSKNPPVILVAIDIFGLNEYTKDVTRRLAKLGAFAVAPDYYFREDVDLPKISRLPLLMQLASDKTDAELVSDLDSTVTWAKSQGGDTSRLGILGFGRGGRSVWIYASHCPDVKAGVSYYGSIVDPENPAWPKSPLQLAAEMKAPVLGLYGEPDKGISASQIDDMEAALKSAGKIGEFKTYPGAPNGFHADFRPAYKKEAAEESWRETQSWFKKYGVL